MGGKNTDQKDEVFISKGMLHPFHLMLEIQVKGTGMYSSRWTDYSITFDVSEPAVAISPLAECFCDTSYIETKCKSNKFQSIYNVTSFIKIFRVANKAPRKSEPQSEDSDPFYEVTPLQFSVIGPPEWQQSSLTCPTYTILGT